LIQDDFSESRSTLPGVFLALLAVVWAYTAFTYGGVVRWERNVALAALGAVALAYRIAVRRGAAPPLSGIARWAALMLPLYVLFQTIPLPVGLLEAISPARAESVRAFGGLGEAAAFAPLSVFPEGTLRHFVLFCGYALLFLTVRDVTWQYLERPWIAAAPLIVVGFLEAALGLAQSGAGNEEVSGTLVNRNHYAGLLAMALPFAVMHALSVWRAADRRRGLALGPALLMCASLGAGAAMLLAIVYSYSRMGFVAALFALLAIGLMSRTGAGRASALSLAAGAVAVLAAFVILTPEKFVERFSQVSSTDGITSQGRLLLWAESLDALRDYPVFGCGMGGFESIFMRYKVSDPMSGDAYAHNDYLQHLIELGIAGFAIAAALMWGVARRCLGVACLGAFAAIGLHSFVDFNLYTPSNAMLLAWISGIAAGLDAAPAFKRRRVPKAATAS
jgi:O-antigen ligase